MTLDIKIYPGGTEEKLKEFPVKFYFEIDFALINTSTITYTISVKAKKYILIKIKKLFAKIK